MKAEISRFVHTLTTGVHTQGVDRKTALMSVITAFFVLCPYCPHVEPIKQHTKEKVMKSIDVYREKVNNRRKGMDGMATVDNAAPNYKPFATKQTKPVSVPDSIPAEFAEDYLEREAILVIDGGIDEESAAIQAAKEIEARYRPVEHTYTARCYILWGEYHRSWWKSSDDRRVYHNGQAQTICVDLTGFDKQDALSKLDTSAYEFMEWWG